jgi:hypothetical protein
MPRADESPPGMGIRRLTELAPGILMLLRETFEKFENARVIAEWCQAADNADSKRRMKCDHNEHLC